MLKRSLAVAMLVALAAPVHAANLATPTATAAAATPAASPSPDAAQRTDQVTKQVGGIQYERQIIAEGGLQAGAAGSLLSFVKRAKCTFDLPAFAAVPTPVVGPPRVQKLNCTVTGAAVGDGVFAALQRWGEGEYVGMQLDAATVIDTDTVELQFTQGSLAGLDPGPLTVQLLVVR
jgi:hypothetical protein